MSEQNKLSSIVSPDTLPSGETIAPEKLPLGSALGLETALEYARQLLTPLSPEEVKQVAGVVVSQLEQLLREYEEQQKPPALL